MSDEATTKRGRKTTPVVEKIEKVESKKRGRPQGEKESTDVSPAKRGRGRPKGSTKKKSSPVKAKKTSGRRGRPKKEENSGDESGDNDAGEDDE